MKRGFIVVMLMLVCGQALLASMSPAPFASSGELRQLMCEDGVGFAGATPSTTGICTVTRYCDYPPPTSVSCTGSECSIGSDWVECDGQRQTCAPPACQDFEPKCENIEGTYCKYSSQTANCYFGFPGEDCYLTSCTCQDHSMRCVYW